MSPPRLPIVPSWRKQLLNTICCIVAFTTIFFYFRRYVSSFPITLESVWQIGLAEVNRRKNVERIRRLEQKHAADEEKGGSLKASAVRHIASVVGYREEPVLFKKCLESYLGSPGLEIMLVGVDGDSGEDMEMVRVAESVSYSNIVSKSMPYQANEREQVFPGTLTKIHVLEPYGPLAVRIAQEYVARNSEDKKGFSPIKTSFDETSPDLLQESYKYAFRMVFEKAVNTLRDHNVLRVSEETLRGI